MAAPVVQFIDLAGRRLVFVEEFSDRVIKAIGQDFRFGIARFFSQVFEGYPDG